MNNVNVRLNNKKMSMAEAVSNFKNVNDVISNQGYQPLAWIDSEGSIVIREGVKTNYKNFILGGVK